MMYAGSRFSPPAKHRILLAVSIALLLHTLVAALIPYQQSTAPPPPLKLQVTLAPKGATPSPASNASTASGPETPQPPTQQPVAEPPPTIPEVVTRLTETAGIAAPNPEVAPAPVPQALPEPPRPAESAISTAASEASSPTIAGTTAPEPDLEAPTDTVTQLGEPAETSPYTAALARRISEYSSRYLKVETDRPMAVELELQLLSNGALVAAVVSRSSGSEVLDRAAYRGALNASPYPEPPKENRGGNRYRVEIVFTPERL